MDEVGSSSCEDDVATVVAHDDVGAGAGGDDENPLPDKVVLARLPVVAQTVQADGDRGDAVLVEGVAAAEDVRARPAVERGPVPQVVIARVAVKIDPGAPAPISVSLPSPPSTVPSSQRTATTSLPPQAAAIEPVSSMSPSTTAKSNPWPDGTGHVALSASTGAHPGPAVTGAPVSVTIHLRGENLTSTVSSFASPGAAS